jgi:hypothetical protein
MSDLLKEMHEPSVDQLAMQSVAESAEADRRPFELKSMFQFGHLALEAQNAIDQHNDQEELDRMRAEERDWNCTCWSERVVKRVDPDWDEIPF